MFKNNRGVTMTVLVVTIIIMLILAAVTMSININTSKTVDLKELVANMELIRTSAQGFSDRYKGVDDTKLPGTRSNNVKNIMGHLIGTTQEDQEAIKISAYWSQLSEEDFKTMGIDIKIKNNEVYFVDYENMSVAYVKSLELVDGVYPGITTKNNKVVYFYDQIKNLKADEIGN